MEKISINLPSLKDAKKRTGTPVVINRDTFKLADNFKNLGINRKYYLRKNQSHPILAVQAITQNAHQF